MEIPVCGSVDASNYGVITAILLVVVVQKDEPELKDVLKVTLFQ